MSLWVSECLLLAQWWKHLLRQNNPVLLQWRSAQGTHHGCIASDPQERMGVSEGCALTLKYSSLSPEVSSKWRCIIRKIRKDAVLGGYDADVRGRWISARPQKGNSKTIGYPKSRLVNHAEPCWSLRWWNAKPERNHVQAHGSMVRQGRTRGSLRGQCPCGTFLCVLWSALGIYSTLIGCYQG